MKIQAATAVLLLGMVLSIASASETRSSATHLPTATLSSTATGNVAIVGISGNTISPFDSPPSRLYLELRNVSDARLFTALIKSHRILPKVTIDDTAGGDRNFYTLRDVTILGKHFEKPSTFYPQGRVTVTLRVMKFAVRRKNVEPRRGVRTRTSMVRLTRPFDKLRVTARANVLAAL